MKHVYILIITLISLFSGCDYLDVVPDNDIETIETIFEKRDQAENWFKFCHTFLMPYTASIISNQLIPGLTKLLQEILSDNNLTTIGLVFTLEMVCKCQPILMVTFGGKMQLTMQSVIVIPFWRK